MTDFTITINLQVIILVDASNFEVWAKAVERCGTQTFQVIAVVGLRAAEGAEEVVGGPSGRTSGNKLQYVHHDVQKVMQNPFYQVQDNEENESHPIPDLDVTKMKSILLEHHDFTRKGKDDTVYDFTGRWMETCEKYEVAVTGTTSASTQGYSSVAIRPDGHVSNIFPFKASQSPKDAIEHLISLKQSLHIISPPASL